jgi:heptosyltransferase I
LSLGDLPGLFAGARVVVGVDTGLTHMAAALGVPTVGIYRATDPAATGIYGCARALNLGGPGMMPDSAQVMSAIEKLGI